MFGHCGGWKLKEGKRVLFWADVGVAGVRLTVTYPPCCVTSRKAWLEHDSLRSAPPTWSLVLKVLKQLDTRGGESAKPKRRPRGDERARAASDPFGPLIRAASVVSAARFPRGLPFVCFRRRRSVRTAKQRILLRKLINCSNQVRLQSSDGMPWPGKSRQSSASRPNSKWRRSLV